MAINDIPNHGEFETLGIYYLNLSWDIAIDLLVDFDEYHEYVEANPDDHEIYWNAARNKILVSTSLLQQGAEFLLKSIISNESPYLLLKDTSPKLGKDRIEAGLSFSDFKTIDAYDLINVATAFTSSSFSDEFCSRFEKFRMQRNRIMHTTANGVVVEKEELIEAILFFFKELTPHKSFPKQRIQHVYSEPITQITGGDWTVNSVCREIHVAIEMIKPEHAKTYFNIDKKLFRFFCPSCYLSSNRDAHDFYPLATLVEKSPTCDEIYCAMCSDTIKVQRKKCGADLNYSEALAEDDTCKGTVFHDDIGCLLCLQS